MKRGGTVSPPSWSSVVRLTSSNCQNLTVLSPLAVTNPLLSGVKCIDHTSFSCAATSSVIDDEAKSNICKVPCCWGRTYAGLTKSLPSSVDDEYYLRAHDYVSVSGNKAPTKAVTTGHCTNAGLTRPTGTDKMLYVDRSFPPSFDL